MELEKLDIDSVTETLSILKGKWKIPIIATLSISQKARFTDLLNQIEGIGTKMLSKELKTLEESELIKRTVKDSKPVTIEYELTLYGETLQALIIEMSKWGNRHRNRLKGINPHSDIQHFLTIDI